MQRVVRAPTPRSLTPAAAPPDRTRPRRSDLQPLVRQRFAGEGSSASAFAIQLAALALACWTPASPVTAEQWSNVVSQRIESFLEGKPYAAISMASVQGDQELTRGFGQLQDGQAGGVPDDHTLFEIGSITKAFTGVLLADQVLQGRVRLDDAANRHLPARWRIQSDAQDQITLLDLATHHSGLPVQPPWLVLFALGSGTTANPYSLYDGEQLARTMKQVQRGAAPGARYGYSNLGVGLLGHALANAAMSESYEELLRRRVLDPLEMSQTRIRLEPAQRARLAQPHGLDGKPTSTWDFACLEACGGLRSSAGDMLKFLKANIAGPLAKSRARPGDVPAAAETATALDRALKLAREIRKPGPPALGLGWHQLKLTRSGELIWWHNGGTGGSRSFLGFSPDRQRGLVVLSNTGHSVDELAIELLDELMTE